MLNPRPKPPLPGGEHVQFIDTGPQRVSPGATRVELIPVGDGGPGPLLPRVTRRKKRKPVLPTRDELAKLPKPTREAFARRCTDRVRPRLGDPDPAGADAAMIAAERAVVALLRTSIDLELLRLIRRDFERFAWLARKKRWTDDTPVSPDVVGPLWPKGRAPKWAAERTGPRG